MTPMNRRTFLASFSMATMAQSRIASSLSLAASATEKHSSPVRLLSQSDQEFLVLQARTIMDSAKLAPGQANGQWRNQTPYTVHVPGGNMGYPAFWVRDAVMMLESDFIGLAELEGWIRLMSSTIRDQVWNVRPGVVVPAFAVPDHINLDGKASYYPGSYETGTKQGGNPWGKYPPLDDQFYYIAAVHWQWKKSGSTDMFLSKIRTAFGEMPLADLCQRIYDMVPSDSATALCIAGDVDTENAKDFGFCDSVSKSGNLLFASVLKFVAAQQLAELYSAVRRPQQAARLRSDARKIRAALAPVFSHSTHPGEAWLHSATGVGNQPDVWGSAYAVYCGAVEPATAQQIGRSLVRAYREKTAVREGCVRSILSDDAANPKGWQKTVSAPGVYQNGGYWGTPIGWYLAAMHKVDPASAADMAKDYVAFLRNHQTAKGISESWEWFNPDTGRTPPLYVATVGLPYGCLRVAGLLDRRNLPVKAPTN